MDHQRIAVLDYGSQYSQLICRRVREQQVYAELIPWDQADEWLSKMKPQGIILSGGPNSVYDNGAPTLPEAVIESNVPVLGICYGLQLLAHWLGGRVSPSREREYGAAIVNVAEAVQSPLLAELPESLQVWMSHGDRVEQLPPAFSPIAASNNSPFAAISDENRRLYGIQFHPEVVHTPLGGRLLDNFVKGICGCVGDWTPGNFVTETVARIREQVGEHGHAICGLSGGVDSAVAASLAHEAIGDRLTCVFVDHGLLRKGEAEQVVRTFGEHQGMRLEAVDASEEFLTDLAGVADPEQKRKLIGARFIRVFESEAARLAAEWGGDDAGFLVQGTLYPDVIESASRDDNRHARTIKTHHNVGGLPEDMSFRAHRALAHALQRRGSRRGRSVGFARGDCLAAPLPRPGLGHPHSRRCHMGPAGDAARG